MALSLVAVAVPVLGSGSAIAASRGAQPLATTASCSGVSVYPSPGTHTASPATQISFRNISPTTLEGEALTVTGSESGTHAGRWVADSDKSGASFFPRSPFRPGEMVTVSTAQPICGAGGSSFEFSIASPPGKVASAPAPKPTPVGAQPTTTYLTMPGVAVPNLDVKVASKLGGDYVLLEPKGGTKLGGPEIVNGRGQLVWFEALPPEVSASDLEVQNYLGKPSLTWWKGKITVGTGAGVDMIMNSHYQVIATVKAGNGYMADLHVFKLDPNGTDAWITAYNAVGWNLKSVGGPQKGAALDSIVEEVDVRSGNVLFEWHSLDHVPPTLSYIPFAATGNYDYFHVNSIDPADKSGTILVSSRNTHAVYEIDKATGSVLWRLGGKKSSFTMGKGTVFALQHDAEMHGKNTISIFDDEDATPAKIPARAIVLHLNYQTRRATLVRAIGHHGLVVNSQGNIELLPNGDDFVGWGAGGYISEYSKSGKLLFDAVYAASAVNSYRAFLRSWQGSPTEAPAVAESRSSAGGLTVYASWNGSTETTAWEVLGGSKASDLRPLATVKRGGFQTAVHLSTAPAVVQVVAEGAGGKKLAKSATLSVSH
ncbi:MAG: arylsulfotransferase family protein [Candidatus Dormiibacterota bacterium]